jgi:hypothetical protein
MSESNKPEETASDSAKFAMNASSIFTRDFYAVLARERRYLSQRRNKVADELSADDQVKAKINSENQPIGLAFSGGGIRSASFNFGIVQGLSKFGLLPLVDYLTSVSGGGFTASCLTSLLSLEENSGSHEFPFNTTWDKFPFNPEKKIFEVDENAVRPSFKRGQNEQMRHLREKGNYLIPRGGVLSRDTLRVLGSVLGGMGYILTVYLLALVAISAFHFGLVSLLTGSTLTSVELRLASLFSIVSGEWVPVSRYLLTLVAGMILSIVTSFVLRAYYHPGRSFQETSLPAGLTLEDVRDDKTISRIFWVSLFIFILWIVVLKLISSAPAQIFWIWLPPIFALGMGIGLIIFRVGMGGSRYDLANSRETSIWSSANFRSIFWAYQGLTIYVFFGALVFTSLALLQYIVIVDANTSQSTPLSMTIVSGLGAALLTYLSSQKSNNKGSVQTLISKIPSGLFNGLLGLFVIIFNLSLIFLIETAIHGIPDSTLLTPWIVLLVSLVLLWFVLRYINLNHISPHYFFRDRVGEVFLKTEISNKDGKIYSARDQSQLKLTEINPMGCSAPYHIVVGAINLPGSFDMSYKDRKSQHFNFTRDYTGSDVTGYALHAKDQNGKGWGYRNGATKYARSIAISGAAASSAIGYVTSFAQAFVLTLFNVRLGMWMINPNRYQGVSEEDILTIFEKFEVKRFWLRYLLDEATARISERRPLVNLSDGGHTGDNGALYPLFQRRCKIIFAGDASQDPQAHCNDLFRVIHFANADLGIDININVDGLKPCEADENERKAGWSKHHCAVGEITYPRVMNEDGTEKYPEEKGWLIYFKPSITAQDRGEIKHYWETHKNDFPHPNTIDQFFDEIQFDIQRLLGAFTIERTLDDLVTYYEDQLDQTSKQIDELVDAHNLRDIEPRLADPQVFQMAVTGLEDIRFFLKKKREIVKSIQSQKINYVKTFEFSDEIIRDLREAMIS